MKLKKIILSIIFISSINLSFAQVIDGFVGNVGLNQRFIEHSYSKDELRPSGSLGIFKKIKLGKRSALRLELLILQLNSAQFRTMFLGNIVDSRRKFQQSTFLSFAPLYKFKPKKFGFHIGPQANLLLLRKRISREFLIDDTIEESPSSRSFIAQHYITTDYGMKLGLDLSISKRISMTFEYYRTFLDKGSFNYDLDHRTSFFSLGFIYSIKEEKASL